jgi:serine/threonine protein kinase
MEELYEKFKESYKFQLGKVLGKGGFGIVREIIINGKVYAGKLVKKDAKIDNEKGSVNEKEEKNNIILFLQNPNIVKIYKIYQEIYDNPLTEEKEIYNLIIMEKANLKDLRTLIKYLYNDNSGKLINNAFIEVIGDNLLRFFVKQIINGFEALERNELIHFDIKPENILIFKELALKLSDFGLLREVYKVDKIRIPGGTPGYFSPDYYKSKGHRIPVQDAKKQDYFALGATIFLLKYNQKMIKVKNNKRSNKKEENLLNQEYIIDLLPRIIIKIQSNMVSDRDFVNFLCSLIQIDSDDRPSFEEIYRNKWVNKDVKYISEIVNGFRDDDVYLIKELRKSDFLKEKKQEKEIIKRKKFFFNSKKQKKEKEKGKKLVFNSKKQKKINNNSNNNSYDVSTDNLL